ncbi:MAG: hypothetical protein GMKNLPBB_02841 [Myxococcota bacterium]|nr:hypothetical protein [Myxococcota bacterium]
MNTANPPRSALYWSVPAAAAACAALAGAAYDGTPLVIAGVVSCLLASWLAPLPLLAAGAFSLSFDRILTLDAGGFTFRLAHLCFGLAALHWVIALLLGRDDRPWRLWRGPLWGAAALMISMMIALTAAGFPAKGLGYFLWGAFDVIALLLAPGYFLRTGERLRRAFVWLAAGAVFSALFGVFQAAAHAIAGEKILLHSAVGGFARINGFNYEPSYFAFGQLPVIAMAAVFWLRGGWPGASSRWMAAALFLSVVLAFTLSRSGWVGLACITAYFCARLLTPGEMIQRRLPRVIPLMIGAALASGAAALFMISDRYAGVAGEFLSAALDPSEPTSTAPRLATIDQSLVLFEISPLTGVGPGAFGEFLFANPAYLLPGFLQPGQTAWEVVPANLWAEILAEGGLLMAAGLIALLIPLFRLHWRALKWSAIPEGRARAELFLLHLALVFGVMFQFNQTLWRLDVWFWLGLGLASSTQELREPPA